MVTERYIKKNGKTFGPYYYESYRDESGKTKKRYLKNYSPEKKQVNYNKIAFLLTGIALVALLFFVFIIEEMSHRSVTGRAIYHAKEIYSPGEKLTGDILFNLREGESIPKDTKVKISLGEFREEFVLSDFVDYEPIKGKIYAENSQISGEGLVFGVPGTKRVYQDVEFQLEIYREQGLQESTSEEKVSKESSPITGAAITEMIVKKISGTTSKNLPFTYELEEGQKARVVSGSVRSGGKQISESEISLKVENNILFVTTKYALEEKGFGPEFLGKENALTFKINVEDLGLTATLGELIIEISYDGKEIAYYKDTILVAEKPKQPATQEIFTEINQKTEIPSIYIPAGENVIIDLNEYFTGATWFAANIEDIAVDFKGSFMQLTPEKDFKGVKRAKVIAGNEKNSLESNDFLVIVSSEGLTIKTSREKIRVGQPVKWKKEIIKETPEEKIKIEVPKEAEKIEVKAVKQEKEETISKISRPSMITGEVVIEVNLKSRKKHASSNAPIIRSFQSWFANFKTQFNKILKMPFELTGKSVDVAVPTEKIDILLEEPGAVKYIIEYETPAPRAIEKETENGKIITIYSEVEGYNDVIAFTQLDNSIPNSRADRIKLYWYNYEYKSLSRQEIEEAKKTKVEDVPEVEIVEEISTVERSPVLVGKTISIPEKKYHDFIIEEVSFTPYDLDENGLIDRIEWVVPHLSNQTYELIIEITNAEHLDENREFISDIFASVYALDGIWSEQIPENHYIRVTFETELNSNNDITIYPRTVSGSPRIEIYEKNSSEIIAMFPYLIDNRYNKVFLTNLQSPQDTFDLKVIGGAIEIDHIIDPSDGAPTIEFSSATTPAGVKYGNDIFVGLTTNDTSDVYSFVDFNRDLILWARMEELIVGDMIDDSSYNRAILQAYYLGDINLTDNGAFGKAADIETNRSYFVAETGITPFTFNSQGKYTFSIWINPRGGALYGETYGGAVGVLSQGVFAVPPNISEGYSLWVSAPESGEGYINFGTNTAEIFASARAVINRNTWSLITVTYDNQNISFYKDGEYLETQYLSGFTSTSEDINIGMAYEHMGYVRLYFNGSIDEVLIFNRTLSPQEILSLYNASANSHYRNFTGLQTERNYSFQGFAVDKTGNKNQTALRSVFLRTADSTPPSVSFVPPTPENSTVKTLPVSINLSTNDANHHYSLINLNRDILLWLRMDDINATGHPQDLSGHNNTAVRNNSFQTELGKFGKAFEFDGFYDTIIVNASQTTSFKNNSNYTWSLWINPDSYNGTTFNAPSIIFGKNVPNAGGFSTGYQLRFSYWQTGKILFYKDEEGGSPSSSVIPLKNWTHIAITYSAGNITYYINGEINGSYYANNFRDEQQANLILGWAPAMNSPPKDYYDGKIDEFIMFNRTLSRQEIRALYNASANKYYNQFTNLAEGAHTVRGFAVDYGGNLNSTELRTFFVNSIPLSSCGNLTQENAIYSLKNSVVSTETCFFIQANNITLNGKDYSITYGNKTGGAYYGIFSNANATKISNLRVTRGNNASISDSRIGIYLERSKDATISSINATNNSNGIYVEYSNNLLIENSTIRNNSYGINLQSSGNITIKKVFFHSNSYAHINTYSQNVTMTNFVMTENVNGIYLRASSGSRFAHGTITNSTGDAISLSFKPVDNNLFENITFFRTSGMGFAFFQEEPVIPEPKYSNITLIDVRGVERYYVSGINLSFFTVVDSSHGSIRFIREIDDMTGQNFSADISIKHNSVFVNSSRTQLNLPANITLYNLPTNFTNPAILKDGSPCNDCYNFTSLNAGTVIFNVTSWSNYSIGEYLPESTPPTIEFVPPTPNDGALIGGDAFTVAVNVTTYNSTNLSTIRYRLYNSLLILINETFTLNRNITYQNLAPGNYTYIVWANDSAGKNATTSSRTLTILPSCFNTTSECIENQVCTIEEDCYLHSGMCSDNVCDFTLMSVNAKIYTLHDENGNGRNLHLRMTSNTQRAPLTFLPNARIIFSGRDGTDLGVGSLGGNGGTLTITVPDLFNTKNARFIGTGGYTTLSAGNPGGGKGGNVILNYRGLIRKFDVGTSPPILTGGNAINGPLGNSGTTTYNKDLNTCPRDADINEDGRVTTGDVYAIESYYNEVYGAGDLTDLTFKNYDINCDNKLSVIEISRIGFEIWTR